MATTLAAKLSPPPPPEVWTDAPAALRIPWPGRPPELRVVARSHKKGGLNAPRGRAQHFAAFVHHELQAAELMLWAMLAFPETPLAFRKGLLRVCLDEVRHMGLYVAHIEKLGFQLTDFPVRDWFCERVPRCNTPLEFVSVMGMGLEAANLDHAVGFAAAFRAAGDEEGAVVQDTVGREEIAHVRFAVQWCREWSGEAEFYAWAARLPAPLSPMLMKGKQLNRDARLKSGLDEAFLTELWQWQPSGS